MGLTANADQPDHKKIHTPKLKMDNEAVQKLQTSYVKTSNKIHEIKMFSGSF